MNKITLLVIILLFHIKAFSSTDLINKYVSCRESQSDLESINKNLTTDFNFYQTKADSSSSKLNKITSENEDLESQIFELESKATFVWECTAKCSDSGWRNRSAFGSNTALGYAVRVNESDAFHDARMALVEDFRGLEKGWCLVDDMIKNCNKIY